MTKKEVAAAVESKLSHVFGVTKKSSAGNAQLYKACAMVARDLMMEQRSDFVQKADNDRDDKKIYYLSM